VLTTVPSAFVCTRCKAQGKHWSFHCDAAVADLVVVEALEAAEQAALGVVVLVAGASAQVEADVVVLAEDSVATADGGVGEACSEEGWRAPSPGRSRSRSLASALQHAKLLST
jgi:hypothetical protein